MFNRSSVTPMRVFLTHNPEDLEAYYGRALPELEAIAEAVPNPTGHDLDTAELIEASTGCDIIVSHRGTRAEPALFERSPRLLAFLRCAVDISDVDVDAAGRAGVLVGRAAKSFIPSTAELALGLMLDVARNVSVSTIDYQSGAQASTTSACTCW
jgi:D-3-phosphoglycerate dehydrogenase